MRHHDPSQAGIARRPRHCAPGPEPGGRRRRHHRRRAGGRLRVPQASLTRRLRLHRGDAAVQGAEEEPARTGADADRPVADTARVRALGGRVGDRRTGLHQHPPQARRQAGRGRRGLRRGRAFRPSARARHLGAGGVRLGQPDRAAARRPRAPGRAGRLVVPPVRDAGLEGQPRVLLQRRGRADRHAGGIHAGAAQGLQAR